MDKQMEQGACGRVAYAYVPVQTMNELYADDKALKRGTLFPELDIPMPEYSPMAR